MQDELRILYLTRPQRFDGFLFDKTDLVKTNLCFRLHPYRKTHFPQIYPDRTFRANFLCSIKAWFVENEYLIDKAAPLSFKLKDWRSP